MGVKWDRRRGMGNGVREIRRSNLLKGYLDKIAQGFAECGCGSEPQVGGCPTTVSGLRHKGVELTHVVVVHGEGCRV